MSDVVAAVVAVLFVLNPAIWGPGMGLRVTDVLLGPVRDPRRQGDRAL